MQHYHVLLANGDPEEDTPEGHDVADLHFSAGGVSRSGLYTVFVEGMLDTCCSSIVPHGMLSRQVVTVIRQCCL